LRFVWIRSCFLLASALDGNLEDSDRTTSSRQYSILFLPGFGWNSQDLDSDQITSRYASIRSCFLLTLALDGIRRTWIQIRSHTLRCVRLRSLLPLGFRRSSRGLDLDQITSRHVRIRSHFRLGFGLALALDGRLVGPRFRSDHSSRCVLIHVAFRHAMPRRAASRLFIEE